MRVVFEDALTDGSETQGLMITSKGEMLAVKFDVFLLITSTLAAKIGIFLLDWDVN